MRWPLGLSLQKPSSARTAAQGVSADVSAAVSSSLFTPRAIINDDSCQHKSLESPPAAARSVPAPVGAVGSPPPAPRRDTLTSHGHPRSTFRRTLERGNLLVAEATLGEIGRPSLEDLVELTALMCVKQ